MRLPVSGLMMLAIAGILFFLFIGFNTAFNGENGIQETIWEAGNKTLDGSQKAQFDDIMPQLSNGLGISCVLCFFIAIFFFVMDVLHNSRGGVDY